MTKVEAEGEVPPPQEPATSTPQATAETNATNDNNVDSNNAAPPPASETPASSEATSAPSTEDSAEGDKPEVPASKEGGESESTSGSENKNKGDRKPTVVKTKNPWSGKNILDFMFYCCPDCDFKGQSEEGFIKHAGEKHHEVIMAINQICKVLMTETFVSGQGVPQQLSVARGYLQ